MSEQQQHGFTLIELLTALAIVGILATIAMPTYQGYVARLRRLEGKAALLDMAVRMQHYYSQNLTFEGASLSALGLVDSETHSRYQLTIGSLSQRKYVIAAVPIGGQAKADKGCGNLQYNQAGKRAVSGARQASDCWA